MEISTSFNIKLDNHNSPSRGKIEFIISDQYITIKLDAREIAVSRKDFGRFIRILDMYNWYDTRTDRDAQTI